MSDSAFPGSDGPEIPELERAGQPLRDGIGEEDHAIPIWFNVAFLASIGFAAVYIPYYTLSGWSSSDQYAAQVERAEASAAQVRESLPKTNPFRGDQVAIQEGAQLFATVCAACHLPDGSGLVGPSLIDPYWKYPHDDAALFETVAEGRPGGMPPWGAQLSNEKIWKILAYIETLPKRDEPGVGSPDYSAGGGT